jgi:TonB family protein
VAADTALSPFGLYTQDLLTAIATQWHILGRTHQASLPSTRAQVRIAFELDPQGQVTGLRVQSSSGHPLADLICQDAILSRSPFGPWSPEMLAHLGKAQTVQIHFFYE